MYIKKRKKTMDSPSFYNKRNIDSDSNNSSKVLNNKTNEISKVNNNNIKREQKNKNEHIKIKDKKIILTSALPYANGEIHLGHIASTYLPADVFTRFIKLTGSQIYHICATDDFGTSNTNKIRKRRQNTTRVCSNME